MKYIILSIVFSQISYSQISKFNYTSIIERERDKKEIAHYIDIADTFKKCEFVVAVDEDKKTITISRKYISPKGEAIDEFENYNFVKKEIVDGNAYMYYSVDFVNKSYVEFMIGIERTYIFKNCDGFYGCQRSTELTK
ncbi:hypothetical protein [Flavobacterium sp.]|uniref:hypothetical protein n=1 Tax=Flavobacterium sp. TaxID=239 RepID=UPI00286D758D|nr:hypothetical protein [Flavobacterium sp.]